MCSTEIIKLCNEIRVHGSIVILGAGASFEYGLPLYAQLAPIVWQIIEEYPILKEDLNCTQSTSAKSTIGDSFDKLIDAFSCIEKRNESSLKFRQIFKAVNDVHSVNYSFVHEYLCKLIHSGYIRLVISFNWDDLLETAWEKIYGSKINAQKINLIKPHGDVRKVTEPWIFPNNPGQLLDEDFQCIQRSINGVPTTMIILGYSERDEVIVKSLIKPNEQKFNVFRISPSAFGPNSIVLTAREALEKMQNFLPLTESKIWSHVDFSNQVGLEHAIMGYRLLPSDVCACARLPQLENAKEKLNQAHFVIIKGAPGCGKSITAYQLAYDYLIDGWEVVKLNYSKFIQSTDCYFNNKTYKTIYIIDDAQQLDNEILENFMGQACKVSKLIITQTLTSDFPSESVTLSQEYVIKSIYDHYLKNKSQVVPIINNLGQTTGRKVGDFSMDIPFEALLLDAKNSKNAWLFNYILRGGWENIKNQFFIAKDNDRADTLLVLIAFKQIITLDKPVTENWIYYAAKILGYTREWCDNNLDFLNKQKLIISKFEIRTLHLQSAIRIITNYIEQSLANDCLAFCEFAKIELLNDDTPLQGVNWLFSLMFGFNINHKFVYHILSEVFCNKMLQKCMNQQNSEERAQAAYIIDSILHRNKLTYYQICAVYEDTLKFWIETVDNYTSYSYSTILNNMFNEDRKAKEIFVIRLSIDKIVCQLKSIETKYVYGWGKFLNRLAIGQTKEWKRNFFNKLPKQEIHNSLMKIKSDNIGSLSELIESLQFYNSRYGYVELQQLMPIIKLALENNFAETLSQLGLDFRMYFLGEQLFRSGKPNKQQRLSGAAFVECISSDMIVHCIMSGHPRDWNTLYDFANQILRYNKNKMSLAINLLNFNTLNNRTLGMWASQSDELIMLIEMIAEINEPRADEWVFEHKDDIESISVILIGISPKTTEFLFNKGMNIDLICEARSWYQSSANSLSTLYAYNRQLSKKIVAQNSSRILESILKLSPCDWDHYYKFFLKALMANPQEMQYILDTIDCDQLRENWIKSIDDSCYSSYNKNKLYLMGFSKLLNSIKKYTKKSDLNSIVDFLIERVENTL